MALISSMESLKECDFETGNEIVADYRMVEVVSPFFRLTTIFYTGTVLFALVTVVHSVMIDREVIY